MKKIYPALAALLFIGLSPAPAYSQKSDRLTDASVRQFYAELPGVFKKPYAVFLKEYSARASDDLLITNRTTITLPGQPPTQTTEELTRQQLLDGAQQAYQAASQAKLWNQVLSVQIAQDGMTAEVQEISRIQGMTAPGADAEHTFIANSTETCTDHIKLEPGVGIQMVKSECEVSVNVVQKL
ncbi:MAG: hypothetical protein JWO78_51 [Micavibrio sp.]|nr:hypothetical protein [Micavibrio sp.]